MDIQEQLKTVIRDIPDFPKPGIIFKDITPIFKRPDLWDPICERIVQDLGDMKIDGVAGMESRGFLFGTMIAKALNVPFILIRKKGKLPGDTIEYSYDLEYGSATLEIHKDALKPGDQILVHDDLLATGGTAIAASELINELGGHVAAYSFLIELSFLEGRNSLTKFSKNISNLVAY